MLLERVNFRAETDYLIEFMYFVYFLLHCSTIFLQDK